jgi:hypothetical protein
VQKVETDAARKQRELIEAQKKAQAAQLEEKKAEAAAEELARAEEIKRQNETGEFTDATKIELEEEFDIDDI